eukprot:scaffold1133_cov294-Chaetoceros_neogracile.AAC.9
MVGSNVILLLMVADLVFPAAGFLFSPMLVSSKQRSSSSSSLLFQLICHHPQHTKIRLPSVLCNSKNDNDDAIIPTLKTNEKGETYFELSPDRRFTVCKWQGEPRVDIREFYERDGKMLPGKKGLSLTMDQLNIVKEFIQDGTVDDMIREIEC